MAQAVRVASLVAATLAVGLVSGLLFAFWCTVMPALGATQ